MKRRRGGDATGPLIRLSTKKKLWLTGALRVSSGSGALSSFLSELAGGSCPELLALGLRDTGLGHKHFAQVGQVRPSHHH